MSDCCLKSYDKRAACSQSKPANLLFAYELQRKLTEAGASLISAGTHPGYAAPDVQGGDFTGPDRFGCIRGYPVKEQSSPESYDLAMAARLWAVSAELTGVR